MDGTSGPAEPLSSQLSALSIPQLKAEMSKLERQLSDSFLCAHGSTLKQALTESLSNLRAELASRKSSGQQLDQAQAKEKAARMACDAAAAHITGLERSLETARRTFQQAQRGSGTCKCRNCPHPSFALGSGASCCISGTCCPPGGSGLCYPRHSQAGGYSAYQDCWFAPLPWCHGGTTDSPTAGACWCFCELRPFLCSAPPPWWTSFHGLSSLLRRCRQRRLQVTHSSWLGQRAQAIPYGIQTSTGPVCIIQNYDSHSQNGTRYRSGHALPPAACLLWAVVLLLLSRPWPAGLGGSVGSRLLRAVKKVCVLCVFLGFLFKCLFFFWDFHLELAPHAGIVHDNSPLLIPQLMQLWPFEAYSSSLPEHPGIVHDKSELQVLVLRLSAWRPDVNGFPRNALYWPSSGEPLASDFIPLELSHVRFLPSLDCNVTACFSGLPEARSYASSPLCVRLLCYAPDTTAPCIKCGGLDAENHTTSQFHPTYAYPSLKLPRFAIPALRFQRTFCPLVIQLWTLLFWASLSDSGSSLLPFSLFLVGGRALPSYSRLGVARTLSLLLPPTRLLLPSACPLPERERELGRRSGSGWRLLHPLRSVRIGEAQNPGPPQGRLGHGLLLFGA